MFSHFYPFLLVLAIPASGHLDIALLTPTWIIYLDVLSVGDDSASEIAVEHWNLSISIFFIER